MADVNINYIHNPGPYGNLKDRLVVDFIGTPLTVFCHCHRSNPYLFVEGDGRNITCLELEKSHLTLDESGSKSQANSVASLDNAIVQSMDGHSDHTLNSVSDNQTADLH